MLALEVLFLLGRYSATDYRDRERPEWPPHPSRLFSALVAAACESGLPESARAALLWLESLPPPQIRADEAPAEQTPVTAFVPVNDPETAFLPPRTERRPRSFPSVVPQAAEGEFPSVWFIWPDAHADPVLAGLLQTVAENVSYLGSSRSPVRVRVCTDQAPSPNWFPDEEGDAVLRVPGKGRLQSLDRAFAAGLRPSPGSFQRYRCGEKQVRPLLAEGTFGEMVVYQLGGHLALDIESACRVTAALRAAALRCAQDAGAVPEILSGHGEQGGPSTRPHAGYAALPFVSDTQTHADGRIQGVAVVLPRSVTPEERQQAMSALLRLKYLTIPGVGRLELHRLKPGQPVPYNLRASTWEGPARRWASVTPVVLDRLPKRKKHTLRDIVAEGCQYLGLPAPVEVDADRHSPLHGVQPSFRYYVRPGPRAPQPRFHTHVLLTFAEEVRGPLLLGADRYLGMGLLRPLQQEAQP